jgi:hypothetical protein
MFRSVRGMSRTNLLDQPSADIEWDLSNSSFDTKSPLTLKFGDIVSA